MIWKQRGFLTSTETPIKNGQLNDCLTAILSSSEIAVIHIEANIKKTEAESQGNAPADSYAKAAAKIICAGFDTYPGSPVCFYKNNDPLLTRLLPS